MLEPIKFEATPETPEVILDKGNNIFEFNGRSLPEDVNKFYQPIKDWIKNYINEPNQNTLIKFNLDYFNSSSARILVKILIDFEKLQETGKEVKIKWFYKENDDVMEDRGEEIKSIIRIPFEMETIE